MVSTKITFCTENEFMIVNGLEKEVKCQVWVDDVILTRVRAWCVVGPPRSP